MERKVHNEQSSGEGAAANTISPAIIEHDGSSIEESSQENPIGISENDNGSAENPIVISDEDPIVISDEDPIVISDDEEEDLDDWQYYDDPYAIL